MTVMLLTIAVFVLAYANGANDNFKGVATLYGSRTASYRPALIWASAATLAGSLLSIALAQGLVTAFSGKGLIPDALLTTDAMAAIGGGAAVTILIATVLGMPTSTTHALTGAMVGVGIMSGPQSVRWSTLATKFAQPLLLSPLLAIVATASIYLLLSRTRRRLGVTTHTCLCVGERSPQPVLIEASFSTRRPAGAAIDGLSVSIGDTAECVERYAGRVVGVEAQTVVNWAHWASSGAVCFARAVNDTPKIAALLLASRAANSAGGTGALLLITAAVVAGGLIQSRRVADTMSRRITDLNTGQGLTANLVTAALVMGASHIGVPVSTTHVSCGAIFGISAANGKRRWRTIAKILATWVTTLPLGLALGALLYTLAHA